jgi:cytochrome b pre-mRNA-processing protein 3
MIFRFFGRDRQPSAVDTTFARVVDASRRPVLYTDYGIPDTVEGRFESVIVHMVAVLRRLRDMPPPADDFAQDLIDAFFKWLDSSLRELGVGDIGVPRRMKKHIADFYGRAHSYDAALDKGDRAQLVEALRRNVTGAEPAQALADYLLRSCESLAQQDFDALLNDGPAFAQHQPG